ILGRRAFADARRGIVVRAVTRAEIAAEIAARLALGRAERDAAQVGADAERDQPVFLAGLGPLIDRLRIAKIAVRHLLRRPALARNGVGGDHGRETATGRG